MPNNEGSPTIIVPYPGPDPSPETQDWFVYLRPESNGIQVESLLLKVLKKEPRLQDRLELAYLANFPGPFILRHHIVEDHYAVRLYFAARGKAAFTEGMKHHFEQYFGQKFAGAPILGAFEALIELGLNEDELFHTWVPPYDMLITCGQVIKRVEGVFIINYDIPFLLSRNNHDTDIAVMVLRGTLPPGDFGVFVDKAKESLIGAGVLDPLKPFGRIFHYSKSPFEELLDGGGYLYGSQGEYLGVRGTSFGAYLTAQGRTWEQIEEVLLHPILQWPTPNAGLIEENILEATREMSYGEALKKWNEASAMVRL